MFGARMSAPDLRCIGALIVTLGMVMMARSVPLPNDSSGIPWHRRRFQWHRPITLFWGRGLQAARLHPLSRFNVSVDLAVRPTVHLRGETLHELSVVVSNSEVNGMLHRALVRCISAGGNVSNGVGMDIEGWGMFNAEQFASGRVQLEYYASVPVGVAAKWRRDVDRYMRDGALLNDCVRHLVPGLPRTANIAYASRVVVARRMKKGVFGEEVWVAFTISAMLVVVLVETVVLLWLRARRKRILSALTLRSDSNMEKRRVELEQGEQPRAYADFNHRLHHQMQYEGPHHYHYLENYGHYGHQRITFQLDVRNNTE